MFGSIHAKIRQKVQLRRLMSQFRELREALGDNRFICREEDIWPCLNDKGAYTFATHYGYHTAWAARILANSLFRRHMDIASDLRFVSLVSAFIPVDFYDYRPVDLGLEGMTVTHADITALSFANDSVSSLSCMHVVEHIGLMRYGDPFDPKGDLKAMAELSRVLAPGGQLLFVVPVACEARIQFNAHRIYTPQMIEASFPTLKLKEFSYITDSGVRKSREVLLRNARYEDVGADRYGCGCFLFTK